MYCTLLKWYTRKVTPILHQERLEEAEDKVEVTGLRLFRLLRISTPRPGRKGVRARSEFSEGQPVYSAHRRGTAHARWTLGRLWRTAPGEHTRARDPQKLEGILDVSHNCFAFQMPAAMDAQDIRKRLQAVPQPHCIDTRGPTRLVATICRKHYPVWDLTPDEWFDVWCQCLRCMLVRSISGVCD